MSRLLSVVGLRALQGLFIVLLLSAFAMISYDFGHTSGLKAQQNALQELGEIRIKLIQLTMRAEETRNRIEELNVKNLMEGRFQEGISKRMLELEKDISDQEAELNLCRQIVSQNGK